MARRTKRTPEKEAKFLEALCHGFSVSGACQQAVIGRRTVYEWRDEDEEFKAAWEEALKAGNEFLEDEARRRAVEGVDEPRFYEGELCGHVRKYSDTLLIFLLKARDPEKYAERRKTELSGELTVSDRLRRAQDRLADNE